MRIIFYSLVIGILGNIFYGIYLSTRNIHVRVIKKNKKNQSPNLEKIDDYTRTYTFLGGKK
jgi:hypothetical protein